MPWEFHQQATSYLVLRALGFLNVRYSRNTPCTVFPFWGSSASRTTLIALHGFVEPQPFPRYTHHRSFHFTFRIQLPYTPSAYSLELRLSFTSPVTFQLISIRGLTCDIPRGFLSLISFFQHCLIHFSNYGCLVVAVVVRSNSQIQGRRGNHRWGKGDGTASIHSDNKALRRSWS